MKQERYGYVYKITNNVNGKIYIGQHKAAKLDENYWGSGKLINQAIQKEGIEHFSREILEWCTSKEHLNKQEIYWISTLNSNDSEIGYNLTAGGDGATAGCKLSEEHRQKLSIASRGKNNGNYGNHMSEESKRRISEANKGANNVNYRKHPWNYGKQASEETKRKMSATHRGVAHPWAKGKPLSEACKAKMREAAKYRVYHNICRKCGTSFDAKGPNKRLCNSCS